MLDAVNPAWEAIMQSFRSDWARWSWAERWTVKLLTLVASMALIGEAMARFV
jgi:hypothetical protein